MTPRNQFLYSDSMICIVEATYPDASVNACGIYIPKSSLKLM